MEQTDPDDRESVPVAVGVVALAVTKAADVATTAVGLRIAPALGERNPLAVAAMGAYGVFPGLLGVATVTLLGIVAVVEGAFHLSASSDDGALHRGRLACYGVASLYHVGVAVYNAVLIAGVTR